MALKPCPVQLFHVLTACNIKHDVKIGQESSHDMPYTSLTHNRQPVNPESAYEDEFCSQSQSFEYICCSSDT